MFLVWHEEILLTILHNHPSIKVGVRYVVCYPQQAETLWTFQRWKKKEPTIAFDGSSTFWEKAWVCGACSPASACNLTKSSHPGSWTGSRFFHLLLERSHHDSIMQMNGPDLGPEYCATLGREKYDFTACATLLAVILNYKAAPQDRRWDLF